jgi:predicted CXXCH cytochrome family protein
MSAVPRATQPESDELICQCDGVSRGRIRAAIAANPDIGLDSLGSSLGCGSQCGCCQPLLQEMLGQSPWFDVVQATRTTLTRGPADRRIVQIELELADTRPFPPALPMQHVVLQAWIGGEWLTRTYTVFDQSDDGRRITIAIRRHPQGRLTPQLLDADDDALRDFRLRISAPNGRADPQDHAPVVAFVAGVGATLALSLLQRGLGQPLHIDYSASQRGDLIATERFEAASDSHPEFSCLLRNTDTQGRIEQADIADTAHRFPSARFYVCGPAAYTRAVTRGLRLAGVPDHQVHVEAFFLRRPARPTRTSRRTAYAVGVVLALAPLSLLSPTLAAFVPNEAHNPGHERIACEDCHQAAPGSTRQQLQARLRYWLGWRQSDVDIGMRAVDNATCVGCHDNPDDRHPPHRFLEPRFAQVRLDLAPERCISCHREHSGTRISRADAQFCVSCHSDTKVKDDTVNPTHAVLFAEARWDSCLRCHDFHGNHTHKAPFELRDALAPEAVSGYLKTAASPYGTPVIPAKQSETSR